MNLFEHAKDCTPLTPCAACELVAFLRHNIAPNIFDALLERAKKLQPAADGKQQPLPLTTPIESLLTQRPLSIRTQNLLNICECKTIEDVLKRGRNDWLKVDGFGRRSLRELEAVLEQAGHRLNDGRQLFEDASQTSEP